MRTREQPWGDKNEVRESEVPIGVQGQSPCGGSLEMKPPEAGDTYGCKLYRNTMINTKHTNVKINTMKTWLGNFFL